MTGKECYVCKYLMVGIVKGKEEHMCSRYNVRIQNVPNCILKIKADTGG